MSPQPFTLVHMIKLAGAIALALFAIDLAHALSGVLLIFFTSLVCAIAMDDPVSRLERRGISRTLSSVALYASVFAVLVIALYVIVPPFILELRGLMTTYPAYSEALLGDEESSTSMLPLYLQSISDSLVSNPGAMWTTIFKTFGGFTSFLAIFFIAFFLTVQAGGVRGALTPLVPTPYRRNASIIFDRIQERIASWLWGKTLSSLVVGLLTLIGLMLFGIPYAITLAIVAFMLNFIPFVGPFIAAIPAVALALSDSIGRAAAVALLYFFVNGILESFVFGPLLMRQAVHINPAVLILSVITGAYLGGILGIILAIPAAAVVYLGATEYLRRQRSREATTTNLAPDTTKKDS